MRIARSPVPRMVASAVLASTLAGCLPDEARDLRDVSWAAVTGINLNCPHDDPVLVAAHYHDITSDSKEEAFVTMRCGDTPASQLEVFKGGTDPDHPDRLKVIVHRESGIILDSCVYFSSRRAFVAGSVGSGRTVIDATWDRTTVLVANPSTMKAHTVPGCT